MPIKIHHGPPGSYKTAGAMNDDFLREARAGRVIVTNVRGVSRERVLDVYPDMPDTFDVIHVDDKSEEGRLRWAKWFHWVPKGAFIFIDEVQDIWPKRWRESDIRALDYPGGLNQATADDRPFNWEQAFDKHRHWNWDMVLTTPSYKKVRDDVKGVADAAYKHKDLALVGWTGRYIEAMHLADDAGSSQSDFLTIERKKVSPNVFKIYDSTATGQFRINLNGFNLFKSPRVMLLLGVLGLAIYFAFGRGHDYKLFPGAAKAPVAQSDKASGTAAAPSDPAAVALARNHDDDRQYTPNADGLTPFGGEDVFIVASLKSGGHWKYSVSYANAEFTQDQILDMGYTISAFGSCGLEISREGFKRFITCGKPKNKEAPPPAESKPDPKPEQPEAV